MPGFGKSTAADWDVSGAHMAERCALFIIICLGEAILVSGRTFSELPFSALTGLVFATGFIGTVAMWWLYFRFGHARAAHRIEHDETPGRLARLAFTYGHIPILAGIIVHAVAVEFMFSHPHETGNLGVVASVLGGSGLFLAGNLWFKGATSGRPPLSHLAGLVFLILLAFRHAVCRGLRHGHSGDAGADRRRGLGIPVACRCSPIPDASLTFSLRRADPAAARR